MPAIRYVAGNSVRVERPEGSIHVRVQLDDLCVRAALVKRVFPLSAPRQYLSIQNAEGKEVAIVRDPENLDPDSKRAVAEELDRRYFTPAVERIDLLRAEAGMWHFEVQTQRGPSSFYVRNWRDSAHEISPGRWQIFSVDGARYEIMDLEAMDARSRKFMDLLL